MEYKKVKTNYKESTIKLLLKIMDSLYKEMETYDHYSEEHSSLFELLEFADEVLADARGETEIELSKTE